MNPKSQIFCDMDGVLVNFLAGARKHVNHFLVRLSNEEYRIPFIAKLYKKILDEVGPDFRVKSDADLRIKPIRNLMFFLLKKNPGEFFNGLPPLADGVQLLWPFLDQTAHSVSLLTAGVPGSAGSMTTEEGKRLWAARELSPAPKRLICAAAVDKHQFAVVDGVANILIDDKLSTIEQWNAAGGFGILHVSGQSVRTIQKLRLLGL